MTKSAKQDTTKASAGPAETEAAETESAATIAADAPAAEARAAEARAADAPAAEAPDETADAEGKPDLDETKRKFREALERKHQARGDAQGNGGGDGAKINSAHGPAASRRNFRRKSG